ncbi:hypothetical protein M0R19_01755 [Candidatus Pacearchaeota archaeon]|jgi:uncharacterized protein YfkK (UPF0435 family)|nr:hypothetical protein [Candidatus Pacearchaeota archaeon]
MVNLKKLLFSAGIIFTIGHKLHGEPNFDFLDNRYDWITLKMQEKNKISLGYDTDNDNFEDLRFYYEIVGKGSLKKCEVRKNENNNETFSDDKPLKNTHEGIINERYDKATMKFNSEQTIVHMGYDTDNDNFEDLRYCYSIIKVDKDGTLICILSSIFEDKNKNHIFEKDEKIWNEGDLIPEYKLPMTT